MPNKPQKNIFFEVEDKQIILIKTDRKAYFWFQGCK